jgi:hypothetical protein
MPCINHLCLKVDSKIIVLWGFTPSGNVIFYLLWTSQTDVLEQKYVKALYSCRVTSMGKLQEFITFSLIPGT